MELAWINDEMCPLNEVPAALLDRGLYFGDGVYEVIRSYDGRLFAFEEHMARFERSLREIYMDYVDVAEIRRKVVEAFERAGHANAKIYFHVTRGSEMRDHLPSEGLEPNFFLTLQPLGDSAKVKEAGLKVSTFPDWRWKRCDIKSLNLLPNIMARIDAAKKGAAEAILVDETNNTITEGAGSAFFTISGKEKALYTRPLGHEILPSITRSMVMKIAQHGGLSIAERAITPAEAAAMDEMFIAVTTKDIVPVVAFNNQPVGAGRPGECTKKLIAEFAALVRSMQA